MHVWGEQHTHLANLDRLRLLQKRVVRIISGQPFLAYTDPIFKDLKIVKFDNIYLLHIGKLMYHLNVGLLPKPSTIYFALMLKCTVHYYRQEMFSFSYS